MIVDGKLKKNMQQAVALIKAGELVAFPTETVYGLGANAFNVTAIEKIFAAKARPFADPLIVHVADAAGLEKVARRFSKHTQEKAEKLIARFWPGPLTLVFEKQAAVSEKVTGGLSTVGVRMPQHIVALALIKNAGSPIAAPSANIFQSLSPTTAEAVEKELGERVSLILDGGPCLVGVESTVLSLADGPMILRPGGIGREDLEYCLGESIRYHKKSDGILLSPGLLDFHYAPKKPIKVFSRSELLDRLKGKVAKRKLSQTSLLCFSKDDQKCFASMGFKDIAVLSLRGNLDEAARELFSQLRRLDESDAQALFAVLCPDERLGVALNDRLRKAEHE